MKEMFKVKASDFCLNKMGCGKTLTAIAVAGAAYQMGAIEKILIVAPTSVCAVWPKEFEDAATFKFKVNVLLGDKRQRIRELEALKAVKKASGLTYEQLAELIGVNKVWLASVFEGQQYVPEEYTLKLAEALKISPSATAFLNSHPYKGNTDPILYRLHEVIDTYGPAIKDIIHEQGGNAIMSAIDFGLDVDVTEDAEGNHRVIIKFDGKLLPYAKKGKYPW